MDLARLKEHDDKVLALIDPLSRIEKLIALRYLRTLLGVAIEDTAREIEKEYRKEQQR